MPRNGETCHLRIAVVNSLTLELQPKDITFHKQANYDLEM